MKQQKLLLRIGEIFFIALMAISILLTVVFYLNTGKINSEAPLNTQISQIGSILDMLTYWSYVLTFLAVIFAVGFPVIQMIGNPKAGIKSAVSVGILAIVMFVFYQLGDGTIMNIAGYTGGDNVPKTLKMVDMVMFSMYAMVVVSVIALLYAEISKLFK
jgi:hypothetical protein